MNITRRKIGESYNDKTGENYSDETGESYNDNTGGNYNDETGETYSDQTGESLDDETGENSGNETARVVRHASQRTTSPTTTSRTASTTASRTKSQKRCVSHRRELIRRWVAHSAEIHRDTSQRMTKGGGGGGGVAEQARARRRHHADQMPGTHRHLPRSNKRAGVNWRELSDGVVHHQAGTMHTRINTHETIVHRATMCTFSPFSSNQPRVRFSEQRGMR